MVSNVGLKALREAAEQRQDPTVVPQVLRMLAIGGGGFHHAALAAEAHDASPAVKQVIKAVVAAGSTSTLSELSGTGSVVNSWAATLAAQSVFARMFSDGAFITTPFERRFGAASGSLVGGDIIDQGKPIPLSPIALDGDILQPIKAAAMLVMTDQAWRDASEAGLSLITQLLADSIAKSVDTSFFALVNDLSPITFAADGDDPDAIRAGLRQLLTAVHSRAGGRLFFAASPEAANRLACYSDFASGGMSPMGGTLMNLPVVVTDGLTGGELALIDASGIAANVDGLEIERSNAGAIQFLDNPTNDSVTPVATQMVSLFQTGSTAMRAVMRFGAAPTRGGVIATLDLGAS